MLVSDVIRQVGRSFGDTDQIVVINTDYFDWINEAIREITERTLWLQTSVTNPGSAFPLALPADWISTERILYGPTFALSEIALSQLDSKGADFNQRTSSPVFYYYRNRTINLYPLQPNADTTVVTLDYNSYPALVAATGTTIPTPKIYDTDIIAYVLGKAHERNENAAGYNQSMAKFSAGLAEDTDTEANKSDTYPIIQDDPYGEW